MIIKTYGTKIQYDGNSDTKDRPNIEEETKKCQRIKRDHHKS